MPLTLILTRATRESVHNNGPGPLAKRLDIPAKNFLFTITFYTVGRNFLDGEVSWSQGQIDIKQGVQDTIREI
jgi:hypothetical protein